MRSLLASLLLIASAAQAQDAGERLWTVDVGWAVNVSGSVMMGQPRVAPDGTIYFVTDRLYAISPAGEVLWTAEGSSSYVDIGSDGTIYTSAATTLLAYNPDGTERWRYTDPDSWGVTTGPTVGPDGNVYAVFMQGGLGVASFTPDGALRWSVPGFFTSDGVEQGRVAFGPDNVYYADGTLNVESCTSPYDGLVSISLDGDLEWCRSISGVFDPPNGVVATLDGRAIVQQNALPGIDMQAFRPDGERDWVQTFRSNGIEVGPDNNLYMFIVATLVSHTADGEPRWARPQPINNFPWRPVVSPDASTIVSGSNYGFGENGRIIAADAADGRTLWNIPVTGPSAGAGAPAAFSPDGRVVYVPINTLSLDEPDQLWALSVQDEVVATDGENGAPPAAALTVNPNPSRGASTVWLDLPNEAEVTVAVYDALGRRVATVHDGPLGSGANRVELDMEAFPPGVYVVRAVGPDFSLSQTLTATR